MNLNRTSLAVLRLAYRLGYGLRGVLPKQTSKAFGSRGNSEVQTIEKIYVINLDREHDRWSRIQNELKRVRDRNGDDLLSLTERHVAVDARSFLQDPADDAEVHPFYTLADQLFVEPQPRALPSRFELEAPIRMSRAEIAVARSHIQVWRRVAQGTQSHALILEDDIWFHPDFARQLDEAWNDVANDETADADLFYVSYVEATGGAPKQLISSHVFSPERGLWYLSGYILSKKGAKKLLGLLPCRGPIDLWINQQFSKLNVFATSRSVVLQRKDTTTSNSYSILPALSTIGAINSEGAALFNIRPPDLPVFAFGPANSGQSSLAMALSMLGYRCCSDLKELPRHELTSLRNGSSDRIFGAYVNIGCLEEMVNDLRSRFPEAKFIVTGTPNGSASEIAQGFLSRLSGTDVILLDPGNARAWQTLCEHLRCVPPMCPFPKVTDLGQRPIIEPPSQSQKRVRTKWDPSPWIVESKHTAWAGIQIAARSPEGERSWNKVDDGAGGFDPLRWTSRSDTFTGNLALFRSQNVEKDALGGATIRVLREDLGVRQFSAGALSSLSESLFGRFEATFQASDVPGVITGFFLHRNSPHQEIDVEILGNRPNRMLVNVFYNPGAEGTKFDYGYRGCPSYIDLGFDASKGMHRYAIEWSPDEIRWLVDDIVVHRRVVWDPTPIPHLPMRLHFNAWPSRAHALAGRLNPRRLPAMVKVQSIRVRANYPSTHEEEHQFLPSTHDSEISGISP